MGKPFTKAEAGLLRALGGNIDEPMQPAEIAANLREAEEERAREREEEEARAQARASNLKIPDPGRGVSRPGRGGAYNKGHKKTERLAGIITGLAATKLSHEQIAAAVGFSTNTLTRHYREEIQAGYAYLGATVANSIFKIAANRNHKDCLKACMFLAQVHLGWRVPKEETRMIPEGDSAGNDNALTINLVVAPPGQMIDPKGGFRPVSGALLEIAQEMAAEGVIDGEAYGISVKQED